MLADRYATLTGYTRAPSRGPPSWAVLRRSRFGILLALFLASSGCDRRDARDRRGDAGPPDDASITDAGFDAGPSCSILLRYTWDGTYTPTTIHAGSSPFCDRMSVHVDASDVAELQSLASCGSGAGDPSGIECLLWIYPTYPSSEEAFGTLCSLGDALATARFDCEFWE